MKNLLILDLDETLIFATEKPLAYTHDFKACQYFVYKRPYVDCFIQTAFKYFRVAVWTASEESYAKEVVAQLFKDFELEFLFSSKDCTLKFNFEFQEYYRQKKLKKLKKKGYKLENILIVDDSPEKASLNYGNYIRVSPFEGEQDDSELALLKEYIIQFSESANVRNIEKRHWKTNT